MARPEPRGAGAVLREGSGGASEAHADVPALERQGQLQVRRGQEEAGGRAEGQAEEGEDHRSRLRLRRFLHFDINFFSLFETVALALPARAGEVLRAGQGGEAEAHEDVPGMVYFKKEKITTFSRKKSIETITFWFGFVGKHLWNRR